jgi:hypothetical protein
VSVCSNCGNDAVDTGEVCDGDNLAGATCASVGPFSGGRLACAACASFDTSGCHGAPSAPRLRLPQNNTYLGSSRAAGTRKPLFAWTASSLDGDAGIRYELQYDTSPSFTAAPVVVPTTLTNHQIAQDLVVSTLPPVGTRYYWRVRACAGSACSAYSTTWWVNVGRSDRDFNGDGFSDIWISAPEYDAPGKNDVGRVVVYLGGPTVNVNQPSHQFEGETAGDVLGGSYANQHDGLTYAGDLNGDGYSDVAFGAGGFDRNGASSGRFYVHYGANPPNYVADLVVDGPAAGERWGLDLSGGGDINADGFDDLIVNSLPTVDAYLRAQARIFQGGATGLSATVTDNVSLLGKGEIAGDVNGDGFADVFIGPSYSGGLGNDPGAIFLGTADFLGDQGTGALYETAIPVDDINADGFSDWAVSHTSCGFDGTCSYGGSLYMGAAVPRRSSRSDALSFVHHAQCSRHLRGWRLRGRRHQRHRGIAERVPLCLRSVPWGTSARRGLRCDVRNQRSIWRLLERRRRERGWPDRRAHEHPRPEWSRLRVSLLRQLRHDRRLHVHGRVGRAVRPRSRVARGSGPLYRERTKGRVIAHAPLSG